MPELPEVETIVNDLKKLVIGRIITGIWVDTPKLIKRPDLKTLERQIKNLKIKNIRRKGKNILIDLSNDFTLLIHQKLTGHLLYGKWKIEGKKITPLLEGPLNDPINDFIHLILYLDNNYELALSDLRKFAKVIFDKTEAIENLKELKELGPDPLSPDFNFETFKNAIKSKKAKLNKY